MWQSKVLNYAMVTCARFRIHCPKLHVIRFARLMHMFYYIQPFITIHLVQHGGSKILWESFPCQIFRKIISLFAQGTFILQPNWQRIPEPMVASALLTTFSIHRSILSSMIVRNQFWSCNVLSQCKAEKGIVKSHRDLFSASVGAEADLARPVEGNLQRESRQWIYSSASANFCCKDRTDSMFSNMLQDAKMQMTTASFGVRVA